MSSYPPGGDYDERLLDSAPKATKAERQEGYNVNLLASDNSDAPMNTKPPATVDGHTLETGPPPTKESYSSSFSVPWYRQKKWRTIMLIGAILVIGGIVGGAVGGTLASKNTKSDGPSSSGATGPSIATGSPTSKLTSSLTPSPDAAQPTSVNSGAPTGSDPTNPTAIAVTSRPLVTPGVGGNNVNGDIADSAPVVAPVVVWSG